MKPETEGKAKRKIVPAVPWRVEHDIDVQPVIINAKGIRISFRNDIYLETICKAVNAHEELLASLKETRDTAAFLMRLLAQSDTKLISKLDHRFDGFGKRADEAIARAEAAS